MSALVRESVKSTLLSTFSGIWLPRNVWTELWTAETVFRSTWSQSVPFQVSLGEHYSVLIKTESLGTLCIYIFPLSNTEWAYTIDEKGGTYNSCIGHKAKSAAIGVAVLLEGFTLSFPLRISNTRAAPCNWHGCLALHWSPRRACFPNAVPFVTDIYQFSVTWDIHCWAADQWTLNSETLRDCALKSRALTT
jgi:hypothetical protein